MHWAAVAILAVGCTQTMVKWEHEFREVSMLNNPISIPIPQMEIESFCQQYSIRKLALFGSVLRDDFHADSDIDVLVEYLPGRPVTFLDMVQQETHLSALLGRQVDLRTPMELSRHFRKAVLSQAQVIYERAG
jgi:predicted nucleotidyltransferase